MAKLMSQREMALFKVAMNYLHMYYEDTGGPAGIDSVAEKVAKDTGQMWDEDDIAECCEQIMGS